MTGARRPFLRAGEMITCTAHHPICRVARDIYVGEPMHETIGTDFYDWRQPAPQPGTPYSRIQCDSCGALYCRDFEMHTTEGWAVARYSHG